MKNGTFEPDLSLSSLSTQKVRATLWVELSIPMLILLGAFLLRMIYPDLYMIGFDMSGHIMASMRLHLTSPFEVDDLLRNTFVQVLFYNHGYTTILLPWSLYEVVFNFMGFGITEARLVYLSSLIGILSLLSIYFFIRVNFNLKIASLVLLMAAVTPIHIGLSRAHVGSQVVSSIFYCGGLGFLSLYLSQKKNIWKHLYFAAVFLYIGSDNAFFLGLILQILFAFLFLQSLSIRDRFTFLRKLYFSPSALLSIGFPVGVYIVTTLIGLRLDMDGGFLSRLVNKVYKQVFVLDLLKVPTWMLKLFGPAALMFLAAVFFNLKNFRNVLSKTKLLFLWINFLVYFFILNLSARIENNYIFLLLVPFWAITVWTFQNQRLILSLCILMTLVYSLAVVYSLKLGFPVPVNYGTINRFLKNNDIGFKTLGYLIRNGELHLSKRQEGAIERVGVFIDSTESYYYAGAELYSQLEEIGIDQVKQAKPSVLAYIPGYDSEVNLEIFDLVRQMGFEKVGSIVDGNQVLIELYSSEPPFQPVKYDIHLYNELFDQQYGTLDLLPRLWLGHFGFNIQKLLR
jgi:hypothetical protein